ncbi:anti-sigma factor antagonist [Actinoplanes italicus]|uniref:Anti-sigma factor antagonist n=1 Tax=Actinoplanes italicus TaxID=113567 RepID=A0A2T0K5T0_9ACTN|nr:STAS domain-containing protein [Actinoplanes italicus]PRX18342.1 anti-anti-sigma factor [Actinoplanes italicus]GIE32750.1 anti-sigma factor antagonist [Actinoplanes italicus]
MHIECRHEGATTWLAPTGELDMVSGPLLLEHVERELTPGHVRHLVVDMAAVTFCDSAGIEALLSARNAATDRAATLRTVNVVGLARRTLEITGMLDFLGGSD